MNIAIVGFGLSGASILKYIIENKNFNKDIHIDVYEKRDELGVGIAYMADDSYKLLNTQNEYNTAVLEDRDDLIKWISENYKQSPLVEGMLPRPIYGDYIRNRYGKYFSNNQVSFIKEEVIDIEKSSAKFMIETTSKKQGKSYDAIFLSIGQSYYRDFYDLKGIDAHTHDPFPLREKIVNIEESDKLGIIGSGPTSIDIYRYIRKYYEIKEPLYFFTQDTFFPLPFIKYEASDKICSIDKDWINDKKDKDGFISLSEFDQALKDDFARAGYDFIEIYEKYKENNLETSKKLLESKTQSLAFYQKYSMDLWYVGAELYNSFKGLDKDIFYNKHFKILDFFMAQTPTETMENLIKDIEESKIKIVYDTSEIEYINDRFVVRNKADLTYKVDRLFNATGFEKDLRKAIGKDKLLKNLYDRHFIEPHPSGSFINLSYPAYNPITSVNGIVENLYLTGMWAGAVDLSNNDIRSVQISGRAVAKDFMDKI